MAHQEIPIIDIVDEDDPFWNVEFEGFLVEKDYAELLPVNWDQEMVNEAVLVDMEEASTILTTEVPAAADGILQWFVYRVPSMESTEVTSTMADSYQRLVQHLLDDDDFDDDLQQTQPIATSTPNSSLIENQMEIEDEDEVNIF